MTKHIASFLVVAALAFALASPAFAKKGRGRGGDDYRPVYNYNHYDDSRRSDDSHRSRDRSRGRDHYEDGSHHSSGHHNGYDDSGHHGGSRSRSGYDDSGYKYNHFND